jgi:hypothetical protein
VAGGLKGHGLETGDLPWFHRLVERLNGIIRSVAQGDAFRPYVTFIDPSAAFASRDVCAGAKSLFHPLSYVLNESFHPNVAGNAVMAGLLDKQFLRTPL